MSSQLQHLLAKGGHEIKVVEHNIESMFQHFPASVKKYGNEALHVTGAIKTLLGSKEAIAVEALLSAVIPGTWVPETVGIITKAINIAIPAITAVEEYATLPVGEQLQHFISFIETHTPLMRHAALCKFLSTIFRAIDPTLTEAGADFAAQSLYMHTTEAK